MRFFLPIFFFSHVLCAQIISRNDWVNKRTGQWLSYSYEKGSSSFYDLITKTKNEVEVKPIKVSATQLETFKDSLKKSAFKQGVVLVDKSKQNIPSIELESVNLEALSGQDSIFKFRYKITLKNKKQEILGERFLTRMGDDKDRVYSALKDHLYKFSVHKIKGTSIICVQLCSQNLMHPDTKYRPGVFSYCPDFYF